MSDHAAQIRGVLTGRLGTHEAVVAALDALSALEAELAEVNRSSSLAAYEGMERRAVAAEAERDTSRLECASLLRRLETTEAEVARLNHENGALETEDRKLRDALREIAGCETDPVLHTHPWQIARAALAEDTR